MVREKYGVGLTPELRDQLQHLIRAGKGSARINWRFSIQDARTKLHWLYPFDSKHD